MENIKLRKATLDDMENVFKLSNDPEVRKVSINKDSIAWEDHVKWFTSKIDDTNILFLVAFTDQIPFLGQVRFDFYGNGSDCLISFSMLKSERGKGYSSGMIREACNILQNIKNQNLQIIRAYVQPDNILSRKILLKNGFQQNGDELKYNVRYDVFIKTI